MKCAAAALAAAIALGCGGGQAASEGTRKARSDRPGGEPVELTLRASDGSLLFVGDLKGQPVLMFLFATFDGVCQAALRPLGRFARAHSDVHVVGVAVQPDPEQLVEAYVHALSPPFVVAHDPEERVGAGETALGPVEGVPTYVMLDALGRLVARHEGYASQRQLEHMLYRARRAVPEEAADAAGDPPPLLGNPDDSP
ncbi:MAG: TlpA family protein disulfide reductase [Myxococcota bacterium]